VRGKEGGKEGKGYQGADPSSKSPGTPARYAFSLWGGGPGPLFFFGVKKKKKKKQGLNQKKGPVGSGGEKHCVFSWLGGVLTAWAMILARRTRTSQSREGRFVWRAGIGTGSGKTFPSSKIFFTKKLPRLLKGGLLTGGRHFLKTGNGCGFFHKDVLS